MFRCLLLLAIGLAPAGASAFVWPSAPDKIARALESGDVNLRRAASIQLGEMDEPTAAPLLAKALTDADVDVRLRAAKSAIRLRSVKALDAVIPWLSDADVRVRLAACELIRHLPTPRAVVALGRVLGDPDAGVRLAAASAMGASGTTEAMGPLLGHLDDPAASVRAEVAQSLARIGDAAAAVPLIGKIGDSAPEVRRAVARALGELGDPRAGSALVLALRDGVAQVRIEALGALGRLRSHEAVVAIAPLLDERSVPEVRVAALAALGRIGSEAAIQTLIRSLAAEDASLKSSPVREALETSGVKAVGPLLASLDQYTNANVAAGAAMVLGSMKAKDAGPAITEAIRKGSISEYAGLRALAELRDPATVPTVLELLSRSDPVVRRQAIATVGVLLDPAQRDGRAVEPLALALHDSKASSEERVELARTLGRTGSPRAIGELQPFAKTTDLALRTAVLDALGEVGPAGQDAELLAALDDDNAGVRLHAALALARAAGERSIAPLVERLTQAASEDRTAVGIAVSGALSRSSDATANQLYRPLFGSAGGARDALIEGLGRMQGSAAGRLLVEFAQRGADAADRRKIAEALAGHPEQLAFVVQLLSDPYPAVRAEAIWSAASMPGSAAAAILPTAEKLVRDADLDVAANATAAVSLLAGKLAAGQQQLRGQAIATLCAGLEDFRAYLRANALTGLGFLATRCDQGAVERRLLARDPSDIVRLSAARLLSRGARGDAASFAKDDTRALSRCAADDKSGMVANACRSSFRAPAVSSAALVFIVPDGRTAPSPVAAYSLLRADGLIRSGIADRRGAVFERWAPMGELKLVVPGPLAL